MERMPLNTKVKEIVPVCRIKSYSAVRILTRRNETSGSRKNESYQYNNFIGIYRKRERGKCIAYKNAVRAKRAIA